MFFFIKVEFFNKKKLNQIRIIEKKIINKFELYFNDRKKIILDTLFEILRFKLKIWDFIWL